MKKKNTVHITILRPKKGGRLVAVKGSSKVTALTPLHRASGVKKGDVLIVSKDVKAAAKSRAMSRSFDRNGEKIAIVAGRTITKSLLGR